MNQENNVTGYDSQPGYTQQSIQTKMPKGNNKIIIIVAILAIIGIIAGIFFLTNGNSKKTTNNKNNNTQTQTENNNNNSNTSNDLTEKKYTGTKQNIIVATVGNKDHGKSTLTSAITKLYGKYVTTDAISSAPKISKNNVTYNASFVEYETQKRHYSHYDMPEHTDYVRSIVSGAVKLDGAILVVAAPEGPWAQTREQVKLLQQTGVDRIVVYMSKCDLIDDKDLLSLIENEIRDIIGEYGFDRDNTPVIKGSALKAINGDKNGEKSINELINSMDKWLTKKENKEISNPHTKFNAVIYALTKEEEGRHTPFFENYKPQFSFNNIDSTGTIEFPDDVDMVMPGDSVDMTITLEKAISFKKGDYFKIIEGGRLVGVGVVDSIIK